MVLGKCYTDFTLFGLIMSGSVDVCSTTNGSEGTSMAKKMHLTGFMLSRKP